MEDRSQIWHLRRGDEVVADLVVVDADFPWLHAHVEPAPAFAEVAHLFAEDHLDDDEAWSSANDEIRTTLTLEDPHGTQIPNYLLHLTGESAWWRWNGDSPPEAP